MKLKRYKLLLIALLIVGCDKEPINIETLTIKDNSWYTKDTNKPYTGAVFSLVETNKQGEMKAEYYLKEGGVHGKYTWYWGNGQIGGVGYYKDDKKHGKFTTYNEDGSIRKVEEYKNDVLVE